MRLGPIVTATGFACAALLTYSGLALGEPDSPGKKPTRDAVKALMTKAHKGEKSPLALTGGELKKDTPDWEQLVKAAKTFSEMSAELKDKSEHGSPSRYVAAADSFARAVGEKDKIAASEAFLGLSRSCSSCHYGIPR